MNEITSPEPIAQPPVRQPEKLPLRKRLPLAAKIPLQLLSFLLCLALALCVLAAVLLADLRLLVHGDGIGQLVGALFPVSAQPEKTSSPIPVWRLARSGGGGNGFNMTDLPLVYDTDGRVTGYTAPDGTFTQLPQDIFFEENIDGALQVGLDMTTNKPIYMYPVYDAAGVIIGFVQADGQTYQTDIAQLRQEPEELPELDLSDPDSITKWAYVRLQDVLGPEHTVTEEAIQAFYRESTIQTYLSEKLGSAAKEVISQGQLERLITAEDIRALIEENQALIAQHFGKELDAQTLEALVQAVDTMIQEEGINEMLQQTVQELLESQEPVMLGMTAKDLVQLLRDITADALWTTVLAVLAAVTALLLLANFYNLPNGLTWAGVCCIVMGLLLWLPLQRIDSLLQVLPEDAAGLAPVIKTYGAMIAPIHSLPLWVGIGLLAVSILWRVLRAVLAKRQPAAA